MLVRCSIQEGAQTYHRKLWTSITMTTRSPHFALSPVNVLAVVQIYLPTMASHTKDEKQRPHTFIILLLRKMISFFLSVQRNCFFVLVTVVLSLWCFAGHPLMFTAHVGEVSTNKATLIKPSKNSPKPSTTNINDETLTNDVNATNDKQNRNILRIKKNMSSILLADSPTSQCVIVIHHPSPNTRRTLHEICDSGKKCKCGYFDGDGEQCFRTMSTSLAYL